MPSTDALFRTARALRSSPGLAGRVREAMRALCIAPAYRAWREGPAQASRFQLSAGASADALAEAGFAVDGQLLLRVNERAGRLFATDGVWIDAERRVFPFDDESGTLLRLAGRLGWSSPDAVIDLACGCGHLALGFEAAQRVMLDVNPRALAYAEVNRILNQVPNASTVIALNDVRDGVPRGLLRGLRGTVLVIANMPFGLAPRSGLLPLTSDGGEDGLALQNAVLESLAALRRELPAVTRLQALMLGLTAGSAAQARWDWPRRVAAALGEGRAHWSLLQDEPVLRIDGRRAWANPSPLRDALPALADCTLYVGDAERESVRQAYRALATRHEDAGRTDLAYGAVAVELA
jgi:methylase of polypeptide subunit release factors